MSKRKQKSAKELVEDLMKFMRTGKRKSIVLEEYIELTEKKYHWSVQSKSDLYRAVHMSKVLKVDYVEKQKKADNPDFYNCFKQIKVATTRVTLC